MKWTTVSGIREAEAVAFAQRNLPSYTAMCRAGAAVARRAEAIADLAGIRRFVILCGPGNNGGDGFVAARCLKVDGFDVSVCLTCVPARLKGDAARAWKDLAAVGAVPRIFPSGEAWLDSPWADPAVSPRRSLIIDALLGIGARGIPVGPVAAAIHWANGTGAGCPVLSVDVPSGLDAETGTAPGEAIRADATITFSRPKIGFANPAARAYVGDLTVADIGIPNDLLESHDVVPPDGTELIAAPEIRHVLRPERRLDSHKRTYGHALVVGGSPRYPHAPVLSALAAYRAGCGLVTLNVPPESRPAAAHWVPEAIFGGMEEWRDGGKRRGVEEDIAVGDAEGRGAEPSAGEVGQGLAPTIPPVSLRSSSCLPPSPYPSVSFYDAIAIGPGMGRLEGARLELLRRLVSDATAPRTVVDADALTALAALRHDGWSPDGSALRLILTPHPGEAATLLGLTPKEVQGDRPAAARALAANYHAIVVLKGHNTLVAEPGGRLRVCMGGNPGMATAGTGDVLTGLIVGLLARGLGTEDAATLGVYHHALAGDAAAYAHGQESLIATDLFSTLRL